MTVFEFTFKLQYDLSVTKLLRLSLSLQEKPNSFCLMLPKRPNCSEDLFKGPVSIPLRPYDLFVKCR